MEYLVKLDDLIQDRIELKKELSAHIAPEQLRRMRRSEMQRTKEYIASFDKDLSEHKALFSPDEIVSLKGHMADCTTHREQMKLRTEILGQIEKRKRFQNVYERLPAKYRNVWGNIGAMSFQDREKGYEKVVVRIEEDYEDKLDNHKDRKHIGAKDRTEALDYVRSEKTSGGDKFRALKGLDAQIQKQKTEVSDPFEKNLKELAKFKGPKDIKKFRDQFYDGETYDQRKALADNVIIGLIEAKAEAEESRILTNEYESNLDADLAAHIIGKETHKDAKKRWKVKKIEEMRETMAMYTNSRNRRLKTLREFLKLPPEVQKENSDFIELTHSDRIVRLHEIQGEPLPETMDELQGVEEEGDALDQTEMSPEKKISQLTALATAARRSQNYEKALKYYQEILQIDESDELTRLNMAYVANKMNQQEKSGETNIIPTQKVSSEKRSKIHRAAEVAANTSAAQNRRRQNKMSAYLLKDQQMTETIHGSSKAKDRTKDLTHRDKLLAEDFYDFTRGYYVMQEGKAKKTVWWHKKGARDKDQSKQARMEKTVQKEIVEKTGDAPAGIGVIYDDSENIVTAEAAAGEQEKRKEETLRMVKGIALNKLKPSNDDNEPFDEEEEKVIDLAVKKETEKDIQLRSA